MKIKRVRAKKKTTDTPPKVTDWIYATTAALESLGAKELAVDVTEVIVEGGLNGDPNDLTFSKSGPGIATIQLPAEPGSGVGEFKRVALSGGETMTYVGTYVGKKSGVILRLNAPKGTILGVDKDIVCEVPLSALDGWANSVGYNAKIEFDRELTELGGDPETVKALFSEIKSRREKEKAEKEMEEHRRVVQQREDDYAGQGWGNW